MVVSVKFLLLLLVSFLVLKFSAAALERHLLYHPDSQRVTPLDVGLENIIEKEILAPDGHNILTWWGRAQPNHFTLLYFHGNAGSLSSRADRIQEFTDKGYGIVMMTYRGYSGSLGSASEALNVSDAKVVYEEMKKSGIQASEIVLYGESLGSGVALQVAIEKPIAGMILDAPYTSMVDLAEIHYSWLPSRWLMQDRYESFKLAPKISVPLLVVHGDADNVVPVRMGQKLASLAKGPTKFSTFSGAGHTNHYEYGSFEVIVSWLKHLAHP